MGRFNSSFDFLFGITLNMTVMTYINYAVHQRDKSWQDVKTGARDRRIRGVRRTISQRGQTHFTDVRFGPREDDGLVRRTICSMIFTFSAAPASQAHNDGSRCEKASGHGDNVKVLQERYEGKLMSFVFIFISPCRQLSFSETLKLHFL